MTILPRLYRRSLRALPRDAREHHAAELERVFREVVEDVRAPRSPRSR